MSKKLPLLTLLVGLLALSGCSIAEDISTSAPQREDDDLVFSSSQKKESGEDGSEGEDTSEEEPKEKLISDLSASEYSQLPINYLEKMASYSSYKAVTEGNTTASILFINVDQKIDVTSIKGEYSYQFNSSESSMYSSQHIAYYHGDKAVYKDKNDSDFQVASMNDYLNKYGTYPFANAIEGYKVTNGAVKSIKKLAMDGDNYRFKLTFDVEKATNNVKIQMKEFGQLDEQPTFSDIAITMTLQNNYTPVKLELESHYKAKQGASTNCHQVYTVTFSNFNENIEVPNLDAVKDKFN